ncbi:MAG: adenylate cyclase [Actinomycetota bacterium]|jgi:class 3 adenylate cyclase
MSLAAGVPLALYFGERTWVAAVSISIGMCVIVVFAGLMFGNGFHVILRPCSDEVERVLAIDHPPTFRDWSLEARLALAFGVASAVAGIGIPAFTLGTQATPRHFLIAIGVSGLLAVYLIWANQIGLVRPAVQSVNDLLGAVKRVRRGDFSVRVPVTTIDEFGELALAFNEMQTGLRERESLHAAFGSYVDPTLTQRLLSQGDAIFRGEDVDVTVFFADVRGFTTFAESASARESVRQLNRLFEVVVPVVMDAGGHVNHYIGDGVLAVFGTPTAMTDHADRAVCAAMDIQRLVRREFTRELQIGIGVNTGPVIAGSIGGGGHFEFTVIGDAVNVASRVERMTRQTGDAILITQATLDALKTPLNCTTDRGEVEVRGRAERHRLHAVDAFRR